MVEENTSAKINRKKRRSNAFKFAIVVFIGMYLNGIVKFSEGFSNGWRVLKRIEGKGWVLLVHGEQVPLIWLFVGPKFSVVIVAGFIAALVFLITLTMDPNYLEDIAEDYKSSQRK